MKKLALLLLLLLLTGCGTGADDRFEVCINAGGTYRIEGRGWSCTLPETPACTDTEATPRQLEEGQ